jgi:hypothetical protein
MGDDTPTAILTKGQREYLRGEKDPAQERTLKSRMRKRIQAAVLIDIPLISGAMDVGSFSMDDFASDVDRLALIPALRTQVAFIYRLARAANLDADSIIEDGVEEARTSRADHLYEQFKEDPSRMTLSQLSLLRQTEKISEARYEEVFREGLREPAGMVSHEEFGEKLSEESDAATAEKIEAIADAIGDLRAHSEPLRVRAVAQRAGYSEAAIEEIVEEHASAIAKRLARSKRVGKVVKNIRLVEESDTTVIRLVARD